MPWLSCAARKPTAKSHDDKPSPDRAAALARVSFCSSVTRTWMDLSFVTFLRRFVAMYSVCIHTSKACQPA